MHRLPVTCTARADDLRPGLRRDFAINVALGGLYSPVARRRATAFLVSRTLVDGIPLEPVAPKKSPWAALLLVVLFLALRIAGEFDQGPPLPVVIVGGVLLMPYLWGTVTSRAVASVRWQDWQPRFVATWREIYLASWPLLLLGFAWAAAEPFVAQAADAAQGELDAHWIVGTVAAVLVSFPLLVRLAYEWARLRLERTVVDRHRVQWHAGFAQVFRIWAWTLAAILVVAVLPVVLLRYAVLGSFTVAGLDTRTATAATLAGVALALLLSTPVRAWHEARMFVLTWDNLQIGDFARVHCLLDVREFVRMRTRNLWRSIASFGRTRPQAVVDAWCIKAASLTVEARDSRLADQAVAAGGNSFASQSRNNATAFFAPERGAHTAR